MIKKIFAIIYKLRYVLIAIVCILSTFIYMKCFNSDSSTLVSVEREKQEIELTPEEITKIRDIGQWEFLSVETEEVVDSIEKGFLSEKTLVRTYRGRLSLGLNLKKAPKTWLRVSGDTLYVVMPPIVLLDENFIDEARAKTFYETGTWSAESKVKLYQKARRKMLARLLTTANKVRATENAKEQLTKFFMNFGYKAVVFK